MIFARFVILALHGYRRLISPFLPPRCRFEPTCSRYAIHAIEHHGLRRGGLMALKRLFRCHPLGDRGYDPVPDKPVQSLHPNPHPRPSSFFNPSLK